MTDPIAAIKGLAELRKAGLISEAEYEARRTYLLEQIGADPEVERTPAPGPSPAPPRARGGLGRLGRPALLVGALAIAVVVISAIGIQSGFLGPSPTPVPTPVPAVDMTGRVLLFQSYRETFNALLGRGGNFNPESADPGSPCTAIGGFSDLSPGREVTVYGPKGEVLAKAPLSSGAYVPPAPGSLTPPAGVDIAEWTLDNGFTACAFTFLAKGVPTFGTVTVEVGTRGRLTYTRAQLEAQGWNVELEMGRGG